jgi:lysophospholipase L1-like esterase
MVTAVARYCVLLTLTGLGCSATRGVSRQGPGADHAPSDSDLEGKAFVSGVFAEGRFDRTHPHALAFAWSGSRLSARFTGTTVGIELDDADGKNRFAVLVDGKLRKEKLAPTSGAHRYVLATGLTPGIHEVTVHRLTEAHLGETKFLGFRFGRGGELLSYGQVPGRRIEVIGDSISTGYGNEGADKSCPFSPDTENHYLTYEAIVARRLEAELVTTAWSGKGIFSNRGSTTDTIVMPVLWKRTLPAKDDSRWNFSEYQPDVVVINLGTNDFAPEVSHWSPFAAAYLAFVRDVRAHYAKATLFCTLGPALSDHWPEGRTALTIARRAIEGAVATIARGGDSRIHFVEFPGQTDENGYGCDWHPNLKTHEIMAGVLETALRAKMGW